MAGIEAKKRQKNVLGQPLETCGQDPMTGFYRDGCCNTGTDDMGLHTICCVVNEQFLETSARLGNNLSTPMPQYGFPGLKPGDRWCLCAARWREALEAGSAPRVILAATHEDTLEVVELKNLKRYAIDLA